MIHFLSVLRSHQLQRCDDSALGCAAFVGKSPQVCCVALLTDCRHTCLAASAWHMHWYVVKVVAGCVCNHRSCSTGGPIGKWVGKHFVYVAALDLVWTQPECKGTNPHPFSCDESRKRLLPLKTTDPTKTELKVFLGGLNFKKLLHPTSFVTQGTKCEIFCPLT